jgi:hypothetical protein
MFLGGDNYKHFNSSFIKKCSKCNDTNLRFLGMYNGFYFNPSWLCGQGHFVFPYYDAMLPDRPYVIYDSESMPDFGCCDANYKCDLPNQLSVNINGILGVVGSRRKFQNFTPPFCWTQVSYSPVQDPNTQRPIDWNGYSWTADCGCISMGGGCMGGYYPENCYDPSCYVPCTEPSYYINNCTNPSSNLKYWGPLGYNGIIGEPSTIKRSCDPNDYPDCFDSTNLGCNVDTGYYTPIVDSPCTSYIPLPYCHSCGTLKCSDGDAKYRLACSPPANIFTYKAPQLEAYTADFKDAIYSLPHFIYHSPLFPTIDPAAACSFGDFIVSVTAEDNPGGINQCLPAGRAISIPGSWLEYGEANNKEGISIEQPICLRESSSTIDINTADISNQTIILDRLDADPNILWDETDRRGRPGVANQPFIEHGDMNESGSMVEPELVAIIISESGTGGQVAFQTWPVSFDTDTVVNSVNDNEYDPNNYCNTKVRMKARGYGVMYPFIDDPIWSKDNNLALASDDSNNLTLTGSAPYSFPVFLPGKNYKIGDKIHFKFWQTLDGEHDPSAGEIYREVVLATATITEVDQNGGVRWYEFDGDPISGDCPCTQDKYCGGLGRACYPEDHPPTEAGLENWCPRGTDCEIKEWNGNGCNPGFGDYQDTGSCYPLSPSWETGGSYATSSCSGLVEEGTPQYLAGNYYIPAKAPKYSYAWLPSPDCFLAYDELFLEYFALDNSFRKGNKDEFSACSPLLKVYTNPITGSYDVALRYPDMVWTGLPACRKTNSGIDADTLFVAYSGGDGNVEQEEAGSSDRTLDNYCRVYGFYQQKQYNCDIRYEGQFILRGQSVNEDSLGVACEPFIGGINITYSRREIKTDITIAAPTKQDYLLPEYLPTPVNGRASASFPFQQGSSTDWQRFTPNNNYPDSRNNCDFNYQDQVFDCDQKCDPEFDGNGNWTGGWNCTPDGYKEYNDTFNNRVAWRTNFRQSCGYPWESTCKTNASEDYSTPEPECYVEEGEVICPEVGGSEKDTCDPFCMLDNTSALIAISGIIPSEGCPNGTLLFGGQIQACISDNNSYLDYTRKIPILDVPSEGACTNQGATDAILIFCFGLPDISLASVNNTIDEYLNIWRQRYDNLNLNIPETNAFFPSIFYPYDQNLDMFYSMLFGINGVAQIKIEYSLCGIVNLSPEPGERCPYTSEYLAGLNGESINLFNNQAGSIESVSILNPGNGYAFEVEERYAPTGIIQPEGITLSITSEPKNKRRKSETWSIAEYTLNHTGSGYSIGDTIPIMFNDNDAIRDGIVYSSNPTIEVTNINQSGQITETSIINSGEYYKWIKTGEHRAYPITITVNNYWEHANGIQSLGRHASFRAVVGVDPTQDNYGTIVDIIIDNAGVEYMANDKYWVIETSVNGLNLEHLVDPCKYDMDALDAETLGDEVTGAYNRPGGWRYVSPPLAMNGGNVIKWSDKALSWTTVMSKDRCPNSLMSKQYKMALNEILTLMPAGCNGIECSEVESSYQDYINNVDLTSHKRCDRYTGFYGHRFPLENRILSPIEAAAGGIYSKGYLIPDVGGCDVRTEPETCVIMEQPVGYDHKGNSNAADSCCAATDYTIVGNWYNSSALINGELIFFPLHYHRIYKMGGQDITMTVSPIT